jgi:hypothetical protein
MVLYHYDFEPGGSALTYRGKKQLGKMTQWLPGNSFPIIIEPTRENDVLGEARRRTVLKELSKQSFPVPEERVVVATPLSPGLDGIDAEVLHQNMLRKWMSGGMGASLSGSGTGDTGYSSSRSSTSHGGAAGDNAAARQ